MKLKLMPIFIVVSQDEILYLKATRPDIKYAVNVLSQFVADPRRNYMEAATRVLQYLKGTLAKTFFFHTLEPLCKLPFMTQIGWG